MTSEIVTVREAYQAEQVARECADSLRWSQGATPLREYIESITGTERIRGLALLAYPKTLHIFPVVPIGEGKTWSGWEPYNEAMKQKDKLTENMANYVKVVSGLYFSSVGDTPDIIESLATRVRSSNLAARGFFVHSNRPTYIANGHNL